MHVRLAARRGGEPAIPLERRRDLDRRLRGRSPPRARRSRGGRSSPRSSSPLSRAYVMRWVTRSGAVSGGRITSTSMATAADAGTTAEGFLSKSVWVVAASASPSIRSSSSPSGPRTTTLDRVTGSPNTLTTRRSYSTWSMPSSPRTTWASWIGLIMSAVARLVASGASAVDSSLDSSPDPPHAASASASATAVLITWRICRPPVLWSVPDVVIVPRRAEAPLKHRCRHAGPRSR